MKDEISGWVARCNLSTNPKGRMFPPPSAPLAEGDACTSGSTANAAPRATSSARSSGTGSAAPAAAARRTAAPDAAVTSARLLTQASRTRRTVHRSALCATSPGPTHRGAGCTAGCRPRPSGRPPVSSPRPRGPRAIETYLKRYTLSS